MTDSTADPLPLAGILPLGSGVSPDGHLSLGGCDAVALARRFGTPLYVYDARTVREQCAEYAAAFRAEYPDITVVYASKAFLSRPFARLIAAQGVGFDAVSGGEIAVLRAAGVPMEGVYFHGSNKSAEELRLAVSSGVGRIVIDNADEVALAAAAAGEAGVRQRVLLRVSPGIDAHTHEKTTTGVLDSKFGVPLAGGAAEAVVREIAAADHLEFRGLHMHLGSPIFETAPFEAGIEAMSEFLAEACLGRLGLEVPEFSAGGGFAVAYEAGQPAPSPAEYARALCGTLKREADRLGFPLPRLAVEPGRALVARAGVALYSVGARKEIPGVRTYVSVDGGMGDNIRPAMYGARYEALSAERPVAEPEETVAVAGKYCESGDVLIREARVPRLRRGEVLAIPASGAYQLSMSSNYNMVYRPAVVLVDGGEATLIRRRETAEDLMALDIG